MSIIVIMTIVTDAFPLKHDGIILFLLLGISTAEDCYVDIFTSRVLLVLLGISDE